MAVKSKPQSRLTIALNGYSFSGEKRRGKWTFTCVDWPEMAEKYMEATNATDMMSEFLARAQDSPAKGRGNMTNPHECFIVAQPRSDGSLPKPEKAWGNRIFFDAQDAAIYVKTVEIAGTKRPAVFRCLIEVVEEVR